MSYKYQAKFWKRKVLSLKKKLKIVCSRIFSVKYNKTTTNNMFKLKLQQFVLQLCLLAVGLHTALACRGKLLGKCELC